MPNDSSDQSSGDGFMKKIAALLLVSSLAACGTQSQVQTVENNVDIAYDNLEAWADNLEGVAESSRNAMDAYAPDDFSPAPAEASPDYDDDDPIGPKPAPSKAPR